MSSEDNKPKPAAASNNAVKEPPKKKRKKDNPKYWLVKVPTWVAEEWFNDKKYPRMARVAELYVLPPTEDGKREMKLEITRSQHMLNSSGNLHAQQHSHLHGNSLNNNPLKQFEDIPIPTQLKMEERPKRNRVNVKHGELKVLGQDKLLLFQDKPAFMVGSRVEALDDSNQHHISSDLDDDEDDDLQMKDKNSGNKNSKTKKGADKDSKGTLTAIKGYRRGVIKEINDDRTFTVEFDKTKKIRYTVPERDIRFLDETEKLKANKCKVQAVISSEMDISPQWTPQYKEFLQLRAMKKSVQNTMKIKEKVDIYSLDQQKRNAIADQRVKANKEALNAAKRGKGSGDGAKKKRVKNVRKDEQQYENMIFAAFEKDGVLTQKEIAQRCFHESWNFLRPVVQKLCDLHSNSAKSGGRSWILKPQYRLASDDVAAENNNDPQ
eukprot:CAMPEP_0197035266 /NCGR_PEP_ID=MMETSP1384-20130603/13123_1 /TAXON_ID=29189 /ORGANISM="Ammonia sp." /LENGTH=435 /DNA_ID=CAMNT_0042465311 /DNA_START=22 /DNA_END=1329 /DNA_ORIENTATION=+